jgi:hypothetical protein
VLASSPRRLCELHNRPIRLPSVIPRGHHILSRRQLLSVSLRPPPSRPHQLVNGFSDDVTSSIPIQFAACAGPPGLRTTSLAVILLKVSPASCRFVPLF